MDPSAPKPAAWRPSKAVAALAVVALLLAGAFAAMDLAGGAFASRTGRVVSVEPGEGSAGSAHVRLDDGLEVVAETAYTGKLRVGQLVEVRVQRRRILGTTSYQIMGPRETATK